MLLPQISGHESKAIAFTVVLMLMIYVDATSVNQLMHWPLAGLLWAIMDDRSDG